MRPAILFRNKEIIIVKFIISCEMDKDEILPYFCEEFGEFLNYMHHNCEKLRR